MTKRGKKTPDDEAVWKRVSRTVSPLKKGSSRPDSADISHFMHVPVARPDTPRKSGALQRRQDKKTRRGMVAVDKTIDLHDQTLSQAFDSLRRSIIRAYNHNHKTILVITGKGMRGQGALRRSLPLWLEHDDIRPIIAEYSPAHQRHGGGGAWYIFLKSR
ncbi:MAG: hypothetical protein HKN36_04555 [Hellea sp.]|nr:hypothetical protein [Hellea sp.]